MLPLVDVAVSLSPFALPVRYPSTFFEVALAIVAGYCHYAPGPRRPRLPCWYAAVSEYLFPVLHVSEVQYWFFS